MCTGSCFFEGRCIMCAAALPSCFQRLSHTLHKFGCSSASNGTTATRFRRPCWGLSLAQKQDWLIVIHLPVVAAYSCHRLWAAERAASVSFQKGRGLAVAAGPRFLTGGAGAFVYSQGPGHRAWGACIACISAYSFP